MVFILGLHRIKRDHFLATESWLYATGAIVRGRPPPTNTNKQKIQCNKLSIIHCLLPLSCVVMPWTMMHGTKPGFSRVLLRELTENKLFITDIEPYATVTCEPGYSNGKSQSTTSFCNDGMLDPPIPFCYGEPKIIRNFNLLKRRIASTSFSW